MAPAVPSTMPGPHTRAPAVSHSVPPHTGGAGVSFSVPPVLNQPLIMPASVASSCSMAPQSHVLLPPQLLQMLQMQYLQGMPGQMQMQAPSVGEAAHYANSVHALPAAPQGLNTPFLDIIRAQMITAQLQLAEAAQMKTPNAETARVEASKAEAARVEAATEEAARVEAAKVEAARVKAANAQPARDSLANGGVAGAVEGSLAVAGLMPVTPTSSLPRAEFFKHKDVAITWIPAKAKRPNSASGVEYAKYSKSCTTKEMFALGGGRHFDNDVKRGIFEFVDPEYRVLQQQLIKGSPEGLNKGLVAFP